MVSFDQKKKRASSIMKCPRCSSENPETQRFCGGCGTSLIPAEREEAPTETLKMTAIELTTGSTFAGRYLIIEELGTGGMGRVFRALDQTLGEEIAIKFIRPELVPTPEAVQRFRVELRAARQVVHKNVARMFDLNEEGGVPYITMEYVKGENLRRLIKKVGRMSPGQAVAIARQVAAGLAEAHRLGVIHRDLKPQNIMVDEEGRVRIMDFGLARLPRSEEKTEAGVVMGTPAYVSPEQVEGLPADARSDLYALGIILYEMLTGSVPFRADTPMSLALKHVFSMPRDPRAINVEIPESLSRIVLKCLEKDSTKRYQRAEDLVSDLDAVEQDFTSGEIAGMEKRPAPGERWPVFPSRHLPLILAIVVGLVVGGYFLFQALGKGGGFLEKNAIAVLPVEDRSPLKDQERLCYGLQRDIIDKLFSIPELRVLPTLSVAEYEYAGKNARQIGRELGVDYLLQLTLQVEGEQLRMTADLIDARRDVVIRPYRFERKLENIFAIQDEISRYISRALKFHLVEDRLRMVKSREPKNLEAYNYYLDGMWLVENVYHVYYRDEDFKKAIELYERAIEIDPDYALAYWGIGNAYEARFNLGPGRGDPGDLEKMLENYLRAYDLNPDFAETNLGLGWTYFYLGDNDKAIQFFKRAVELDSNNAIVNLDAGAFLRSIGLYRQAIKYFQRAVKLNPPAVFPRILMASCRLHLGEPEKAAREMEKAIEKEPGNLSARIHYALALIMMHRLEEARRELETARKIRPGDSRLEVAQTLFWAAVGEKEKALSYVRDHEVLTFQGTALYLFLGMKTEAVANIEAGIERGFTRYGEYLYSYPALTANWLMKELKGEPRFREILQKEKVKYQENVGKFGKL